jgi:Zn-dependent protease with chaperone function
MDSSYAISTTPDATADLIQSTLADFAYEVKRSCACDEVRLGGTLRDSPLRSILRALPQCVAINIVKVPHGSRFTVSYQYGMWHALLLLVLVPTSLMVWGQYAHAILRGLDTSFRELSTHVGSLIPVFAFIFFTNRLIVADGSHIRQRLQRALLQNAANAGFAMRRDDKRVAHRHTLFAFGYAMCIVACAVPMLISVSRLFPNVEIILSAGALGLLLAAFIALILLLSALPGAAKRCTLLLPSLCVVFGLMPLFFLEVFLSGVGSVGHSRWREIVESGSNVEVVLFTLSCACLLLSLLYVAKGALVAGEVVCSAHDVRRRLEPTRATAATMNRSLVWPTRIVIGGIWGILGSAVVIYSARVHLDVLQWIIGRDADGPIAGTTWLLSTATSLDVDSPAVWAMTIGVWIVLGTSGIGLVLASIAQLLIAEWKHSGRRRLHDEGEYQQLEKLIDDLSQHVKAEPPQLIVDPSMAAYAAAFLRRLRKPDQIIVISRGCCDLLGTDELRALLAHEWAHHLNGDCTRHAFLRFLARLTLFGDGLVVAFEQSFQYELDADRTAVNSFGLNPSSLSSCLRKLAAVSSLNRYPRMDGLRLNGEPEALSVESSAIQPSRGIWKRFGVGAKLWWQIYTSDTNLGYWYPTLEERLAALASMERPKSDGNSNLEHVANAREPH